MPKTSKKTAMTGTSGPLTGVRVLDLSRILAGPTATQLLGDLGADVIKIEHPIRGDDTRKWGPPYIQDKDNNDTHESAYYLAANRNKRSVTIDISKPEGAKLVRQLLKKCDILLHNFKVGGLEKYGLGYDDLKSEMPKLVYCVITGFGQTGPYAPQAGYDFLAQGIGGIMSLTGDPDGEPVKVGVGIADIMCGMYASTAILAALRHSDQTGQGQMIDLALLDTQVAWLANEANNYFLSGNIPKRRGNAHPNIVPYQVFPTQDGHFILAVGNDSQFQKFCDFARSPELSRDKRFAANDLRIRNREQLIPLIENLTRLKTTRQWIDGLSSIGVPSGPVNNLEQTFEDPQIRHRNMRITMDQPLAKTGKIDLLGNPVKFSETPVTYRRPPPTLGEHTADVLEELLNITADEQQKLRAQGLI